MEADQICEGKNNMFEENIKKAKKIKKKWQLVNIILGLITIGLVFYFSWPVYWQESSIVVYLRFIPGIVLILTRKNNIFSFIPILLVGLLVLSFPTVDGFFIILAAVYMLFSAILRMFRVKLYLEIGLVITLLLGLGLFWDYSTTFVSEDSLTIIKKINNGTGIKLITSTGEASTTFNFNQIISTTEQGLAQGGKYALRVLNKSGEVVIPLDKWPILKVKNNGEILQRGNVVRWIQMKDIALYGTFNNGAWFPLALGDYKIQLVEIDEPKGIIVSEANFSIVAYDQKTLSNVKTYITSGGDPNQYYDTYTYDSSGSSGKMDIIIWVQSSKGSSLSGTRKFFRINFEGEIEETPWDGEYKFSTDIEGIPIGIGDMEGSFAPGIYHNQIMFDNIVFADLKIIVK